MTAHNNQYHAAERVGTYRGKRYSRFVVTGTDGQRAAITQRVNYQPLEPLVIVARNAREALQAARMVYDGPCVTLRTVGPRGGRLELFWGWESYIGSQLFSATPAQLRLI